MLLLSLFASLAVWSLASPLIAGLFGDAFLPAIGVLQVHIWCGVFVAWGISQTQALMARGAFKVTMITTMTGAVLNVVLNLLWIPRWSAMGAAWATLISQAVVVVLMPFFFDEARVLGKMQMKSLNWLLSLPFKPFQKRS
jgi:O-antigen/teichoic acid export membrane protein